MRQTFKFTKTLTVLLLALLLVLAGCSSVTTKSDTAAPAAETKTEGEETTAETTTPSAPVDIELLAQTSQESDVNIIRDQLTKNGFNVKLNLQPDYGSFKAQEDAGNYDIALSGWTTVTGNPDYAVRSLFKTGGDYSIMSDPEIDELIDKAAAQSPEDYVDTYKQLEQKLVFDNAYIAPLYISYKSQAINKDILKPDSVRLSKSRALAWEDIEFNDASKNAKDPLVLTQTTSTLTSLDPIKGNDGSINTLNTNMYVRLINLTDDDKITSDGSLSRNFTIADGNSEYYFILRDDINFAKVEDGKAVDTGERVGADDVIFALDRAKNKDSVPDHRTYSLHEHIKTVEEVTDLSALDSVKTSDGGTVREALEKGLDAPISELVADKKQADNAAGKYQVVKLTTTEPFPQVLNYLGHQSAGIVSKKQVESINTYDVAKFDVTKDIPYGDQNTVTEGASYDNTLYASGPYILITKNDYEAKFAKNPAYQPGTENEPNISNISVRFIADADSGLAALRSGEIYSYYSVPETKYSVVEGDAKLQLQKIPSNGVSYLLFNTADNRPVGTSADLRKAVLYSINQDEILQFYEGNKLKAASTVSPLVDTGNVLTADPAKVKESLAAYEASK
ncbi:ABC transporter substrate-binding protein [Saccharibacillus sp. CPCC 101409]|uniref:ABC transporter substrate-binding protein n=1 Tax=Saccharibacillus sp. CPCC 101409 TaxID=3058041 RepID=UPI0026712292|nr:ABC transporter substrate-binding protein [Saccharibacillus sp. CPCC 101409]MDO3411294.1 ABC transporter substrate-binding protein [Saccharibacillus sp. CPCC 101409]